MCYSVTHASDTLIPLFYCRASFGKGMYCWKWVSGQKPSSSSTVA